MPLLQNSTMTDTGTGGSKVKVENPTGNYNATQQVSNSNNGNKKVATSTAKTPTTATATAANANKKKTYKTYNYSSGSGSGEAVETPETPQEDNKSKNYQAYLDYLDKIYRNEFEGSKDSNNTYKTEANKNLDKAAKQWKTTYANNNALLDQLAAQNSQREANTNNAIATAYQNAINNANEYYNNLMGTYNRSMGYIDQGFNEGKTTSAQARDEAIQLAAQLYSMGEASQNQQTEKDLRSQYISYMNGMKNMNQQLASQGINGGASETAMLGALNGYESNRTSLDEARLAALGVLRQQQMQSDSQAQQTYLNALADLISQRTNQQLGVENTRSSGEQAYANMRTDAENTRGSNTIAAQNNFQNWAADLTGQRTNNSNTYANAVTGIANDRNTVDANYQNAYQSALQSRSDNYSSAAYSNIIDNMSKENKAITLPKEASNTTKKEKKAKEKKKEKKEAKKSTTKTTFTTSSTSSGKTKDTTSKSKSSTSSKSKSTTSNTKKSNTTSNTKSNTSSKKTTSKKDTDSKKKTSKKK